VKCTPFRSNVKVLRQIYGSPYPQKNRKPRGRQLMKLSISVRMCLPLGHSYMKTFEKKINIHENVVKKTS
jgi:hypothetical protein